MKFDLDTQQRDFAASIDAALSVADVPAAARAWAAGNHGPGLAVWSTLAELGVTALAVSEKYDGIGAHPVDLVVALEGLGKWAVPGPVVESVAVAPVLLSSHEDGAEPSTRLASGELIATVAAPPIAPRALDADIAGLVLIADDIGVREAQAGAQHESIDATRRVFDVQPKEAGISLDTSRAIDFGVLAISAQLIGAGQALLDRAVAYAKQRSQFGRPIGSYQAVKHKLADVHIALELARPLVYGAALSLADQSPTAARDASAAKVAATKAAYLAARSALQTHGAIGFTAEYDLSLWILKVRALTSAWGTSEWHRARVLEAL
ncbi:acyl-CoA dehydrogenase family protein [Mycobacteroides abscessus subsp. abscessus]|uniref:Acyl-CoA dehydrogenase, C-terminal domain protein n=1 Tax=Mycobacteroides abscessus MAB_030201_1075 TaxID=1335410 RepID=A0A829PG20_9MYCO|nr:acyl-CoA dehydrogenase [Mycobacteroides abscessus]ETZ87699.1 acyl-CoA dehydrogenase, C-terminal domain protein [Mycobacteroides abscessus MAB_030201_1075]ETZ93749.1 acyl-CoA dehydrogenase, C-terminal domain protein [Mycobacteroides abscessus MAB_030201_1061]AMU69085.1 acyl-CoA dehydrogenase [Mycobacteroides abscessus]ETZ70347.1 acyl-CoA dehydrogenase, C-terminal domain protein [Mycobacteroides abscessus MAB_110811_1470]MDM2018216.1 acyl-CoA dehydrogenase [Mycobacteroides abscessus]